jgi:hypothetical protein
MTTAKVNGNDEKAHNVESEIRNVVWPLYSAQRVAFCVRFSSA